MEQRIGRNGSDDLGFRVSDFGFQLGDRGTDDLDFFVTDSSRFSGVRI
jgi:hypothetical protein